MTLRELEAGKSAVIRRVGGEGALRQHFLDMGMIPGAEVTVVKLAPMGDPMEVQVHGYELTLRLAEADQIDIAPIRQRSRSHVGVDRARDPDHPGLGESGKYHSKEGEHPLPEDTVLTYALVGNQNCGKTTLFNQLTGARQHVGNFPGVTVDRKTGVIRGYPNTEVTDLPGIYSMSPFSSEEIVSRNFVLQDKPKAIINIVDATNIERNLYLTMQLLEMGIPMVVALNMMDELVGNQGSIDVTPNDYKSVEGTIAEIRTAVVDGNSIYFLRFDGESAFSVRMSAAEVAYALVLIVGVRVRVYYRDGYVTENWIEASDVELLDGSAQSAPPVETSVSTEDSADPVENAQEMP